MNEEDEDHEEEPIRGLINKYKNVARKWMLCLFILRYLGLKVGLGDYNCILRLHNNWGEYIYSWK